MPQNQPMPPKLRTILVVDDDEGMRDTLGAILKKNYRVKLAVTGEEALAVLKREDVDLMLLDVRLPGINGLEVLKIVKENYTLIEVIMISAINEVETAVQAMKHGAYHYIAKEFDYDELRSLVRNALERQDLNRQVITLSEQVAEQTEREFVLGPSKVMQEIVDLVQKVAKLPATVLILGESGTGKELLARLIHRESGRREAPFIAVNLAAIPRDLVESSLFGHEPPRVRRTRGGRTDRVIWYTRPAAGARVRLPFFSRDLLEDVDLQVPVRHHLLQAAVLLLELAQALDVGRFQAAKVLPPAVDRLAADTVLLRHVRGPVSCRPPGGS